MVAPLLAVASQVVPDIVRTVINQVFPNASEKEKRDAELLANEQAAQKELSLAQIELNKAEAGSTNWFVSGWRPAVGWTCVSGLAYQVLFRPIFGWIMVNLFSWSLPPSLEMDTLLTILFGMLGLGGYRTMEKIRSVAR